MNLRPKSIAILALSILSLSSYSFAESYTEFGSCHVSKVIQYKTKQGTPDLSFTSLFESNKVELSTTTFTRYVEQGQDGFTTTHIQGYESAENYTYAYYETQKTTKTTMENGKVVETSEVHTKTFPIVNELRGEPTLKKFTLREVYEIGLDQNRTLVEYVKDGVPVELPGTSFEMKTEYDERYEVSFRPEEKTSALPKTDSVLVESQTKSVCVYKR